MTEVGRLFQIAGTAELKARPPYAVLVRGAWSSGRVDERNVNVVDEPEYLQKPAIHLEYDLLPWKLTSSCMI